MSKKTYLRTIAGTILALSASTGMAGEWQLPELMQILSRQKTGKASFIEKKYIGIVDQPIESSGELSFSAPDRLEKHTFKPNPELLILVGDSLSVDQPGKRRLTISLLEHPEVSAFVESIRGTLAGDRSALEKVYAMELTGSVDRWQLVLTPTQPHMIEFIRRIRIRGSNANLKTIEFEQADGDRAEMVITKIVTP